MNWIIEENTDNRTIEQLSKELNVNKIISSMLVKRGIKTFNQAKDFFRPKINQLHDPFLMKDMNEAVNRILQAIENKEPMMIFGDYDVDGTSSVALLSSFLKDIGAKLSTYIPDRNNEGYGISLKAIDLAEKNKETLIIALDCGIKANDQVQYALKKEIDFIICDHHNPSNQLPNAYAILNPKRKDCKYPFKELCGCGVGFKLIQAINQRKGLEMENIIHYLDLVAVAIAADIVPLIGENRILTYVGLQVINSNPRLGLHCLLQNNNKKEFNVGDLMFYVGPRINAAGRMDHASLALELLLEKELDKGKKLAEKIEELNIQRREIEKNITEQALKKIDNENKLNSNSTVVFENSWNKGVIGIVASRLIEKHYKPTIVFCKSKDGNLTGSARSIKDVDLYKILEKCKANILKFGGHKYAAGLTIEENDYASFKESFEKAVGDYINNKLPENEIRIESKIELSSITPKFFRILNQFEPFGPGNRRPIFLSEHLSLKGGLNKIGKNREHLKLSVSQESDKTFSAIGFWLSEKATSISSNSTFSMLYTIDENTWNGITTIQLKIKDIK
ncbi:MAG: single-stranded-DNA-specific exonuclease RecJ [Flavobacteriaceae bacterium]|jgi:single-stranded-DNA-specific exonuclease|nr:single-stranded-DNA-specific exonuclease RecJ [Flavobacteriaceae bacterium]